MPANLFDQAEQWRQQATKLLKASQLVEMLGESGRVELTGSYQYNLMLSGDIDLYLVVKQPTKSLAVGLLNQLINQSWWNAYRFADWTEQRFRLPQWRWLPLGYYLNVKTDFEGARWKVDIWILTEQEYLARRQDALMARIDDRSKQIILKLKKARNDGRLVAGGYTIYDAVLNAGITTVKQFLAWQTGQQPEDHSA